VSVCVCVRRAEHGLQTGDAIFVFIVTEFSVELEKFSSYLTVAHHHHQNLKAEVP